MSLQVARRHFEDTGVRIEVEIAEYLSFLLFLHSEEGEWKGLAKALEKDSPDVRRHLLERQKALQEKYGDLVLPAPPPVPGNSTAILRQILNELAGELQNWANPGDFYQKHFRYTLLKGATGGQYPTPRHVACLMARLAVPPGDAETILDPVAGTGGLLIEALAQTPTAVLTGYDFDPRWAGMGSTNLRLHGHNGTFEARDVLASPPEDNYGAVLANPPFGATTTRLLRHALKAIRPGGRGAFLVPSGVLFRSGADAAFRQELIQSGLNAVITLPEDTFQPFSQVTTHLLLLHRPTAEQEVVPAPIWFAQLERDGYPAGAGARDLTEEPPLPGDLPRLRELILASRSDEGWATLALDEGSTIQGITLRPPDAGPLTAVAVRTTGTLLDWRNRVHHGTQGLLITLPSAEQPAPTLYLRYSDSEPLTFTSEPKSFEWDDLNVRDEMPNDLPEGWDGESSTTLVRDGITFTLARNRGSTFHFSAANEGGVRACLLNEEGVPLTPWLRSQEEVKSFEEDLKNWRASRIPDRGESILGYLFFFQPKEDDENGMPVNFLVLLDETAPLRHAEQRPERALVSLSLPSTDPSEVKDDENVSTRTGWLHLTPERLIIEPAASVQFRPNVACQGFAIGPAPQDAPTPPYRLFGLWVPPTEWQRDGRIESLEPRSFFPEPPSPPLGQPTRILSNIRSNQARLSDRLERLAHLLGDGQSPLTMDHNQLEIPELFKEALAPGTAQRALWEKIAAIKYESKRPRHFTEEDLLSQVGLTFNRANLHQQLSLFASMGLIVPVHIGEQNAYRVVTSADCASTDTEMEAVDEDRIVEG